MAEEFAAGDSICALLGDNIYFDNISQYIRAFKDGGHIFVKQVQDPKRFGVVEVDGDKVVSIEEKPEQPRSNLAQTGCYLYDNSCFEFIRTMQPSARGELEITDVTKWYLENNKLGYSVLQDEWIDAGTFESLHHAAVLVRERKLAAAKPAVEQAVSAA